MNTIEIGIIAALALMLYLLSLGGIVLGVIYLLRHFFDYSMKFLWLGIILGAALIAGALLVPVSPISQLPTGKGEPSYKGNASGFRPEAGAAVTYESPGPTLNALGYSYTPMFLAETEYTPGGINPGAIVIHNTDSPASIGCPPVGNYFAGSVQASTHFCIDANGTVFQFVPLESIAWGNGDLNSPNRNIPIIDYVVLNNLWMNQFTWSIELTLDKSPTTEYLADYPLMADALSVLVKFLAAQAGFPLDRQHVITHRDINSVNRVDPICCWVPGGLAAGAQAFDVYVSALTAPAVDTPTPAPCPVLIRSANAPHVFVVVGQVRIHIPNPEAFESLGFRWECIQLLDDSNSLWRWPAIFPSP